MKPWGPLALALSACGLLACANNSGNQLRARAVYDLNCPAKKLQYDQLDDRTFGVRGCDQKATYIWTCKQSMLVPGTEGDCTWVLNAHRKKKKQAADDDEVTE